MKIKIQYTVEVDPEKVRAEFQEDMSAKEIREFFTGDAEDATKAYIERINVGTDK